MPKKDPPFSETLKTWHDDRPMVIEFKKPEPDQTSTEVQVEEEPVEMDHVARERQSVKDWVRKEIALAAKGKSEADRIKANP